MLGRREAGKYGEWRNVARGRLQPAITETTIWGIHPGESVAADTLFLKKGHIGIGWAKLGDLGQLKPNHDAFKERVTECYPHRKLEAIPTIAGQAYRFVHEAKANDIVVYPSKHDRLVHIGRLDGPVKWHVDARIEPVLVDETSEQGGFLKEVLSTGYVVYQAGEPSDDMGSIGRPGSGLTATSRASE